MRFTSIFTIVALLLVADRQSFGTNDTFSFGGILTFNSRTSATLTEADGYTFTATRPVVSEPNVVVLDVIKQSDEFKLQFLGPSNTLPSVGAYFFTGAPSNISANPGFSFMGDGTVINDTNGTFTILQALYDPITGNVLSFSADYSLSLNHNVNAEFGSIRFNPDLVVPEPSTITLLTVGVIGLLFARRRFTFNIG